MAGEGDARASELICRNPFGLDGRTILVTGASSGIGREVAITLSRLGANIIVSARRKVELEATMEMLHGGDHHVEPFDLSALDEIPKWMASISSAHGRLGGIVHCAGIRKTEPLGILTASGMMEILKLNVVSAAMLTKGFQQRSVFQEPGSIVLISSVIGIVGEAGVAAYSASKGALISLTRSLAVELARKRIRVNCLAPANVEGSMTEAIKAAIPPEQFARIEEMHLLGIGHPADIANAAAFLLADTGRWITGSTIILDGGYTAR